MGTRARGIAALTVAALVLVGCGGDDEAKKVTAELNAKGVATVKLPKAKKRGKYKVVITYAGDSNFNKAKRVVTKFKVR